MAPKKKTTKTTTKRGKRPQPSGFLSDDDMQTVAIIFKFSSIKVDTTAASNALGITKKAWSARWIRVKNRLSQFKIGAPNEDDDEENEEIDEETNDDEDMKDEDMEDEDVKDEDVEDEDVKTEDAEESF